METTEALAKIEPQLPVVPVNMDNAALVRTVGMGDVSGLNPEQCLNYIGALCRSVGLNALAMPIRILEMDGRKILYATAEAGAELRSNHKISIKIIERKEEQGCYIVVARATRPDGREDESTGAVPIVHPDRIKDWTTRQWKDNPRAGQKVSGLDYANAIKKAETQAKRRAALSICGLGLPDESEIDDIKRAKVEAVTDPVANAETATDRAAALNEAIEAEVVPPVETGNPGPVGGGHTIRFTPVVGDKSPAPASNGADQVDKQRAGVSGNTGEGAEATPADPPPASQSLPPAQEPAPPSAPKATSVPQGAPAATPKRQTAPPGAPAASGALAGPDGKLTDETVQKLEAIFMEIGPQDCIAALVARGKLKPGAALNTLSVEGARYAINQTRNFKKWVQDNKPKQTT